MGTVECRQTWCTYRSRHADHENIKFEMGWSATFRDISLYISLKSVVGYSDLEKQIKPGGKYLRITQNLVYR